MMLGTTKMTWMTTSMSCTQSLWKATNTMYFCNKGSNYPLLSTILRIWHLLQIGMCSTLSLIQDVRSEIVGGEHKDESLCLMFKNVIKKVRMIWCKHTILICVCAQWFKLDMTTHQLVVFDPTPLGCKTSWHAKCHEYGHKDTTQLFSKWWDLYFILIFSHGNW